MIRDVPLMIQSLVPASPPYRRIRKLPPPHSQVVRLQAVTRTDVRLS